MAFKAPSTTPTHRELRLFGRIWLPVGCAIVAALVWRASGEWQVPLAIVGGGLLVGWAASFVPGVLRWPYVVLNYLAFPIGWVIGHAVLALAYFVFLTPVALVQRMRGRDRLGLRVDPEALTYWSERADPEPEARRYFDPY